MPPTRTQHTKSAISVVYKPQPWQLHELFLRRRPWQADLTRTAPQRIKFEACACGNKARTAPNLHQATMKHQPAPTCIAHKLRGRPKPPQRVAQFDTEREGPHIGKTSTTQHEGRQQARRTPPHTWGSKGPIARDRARHKPTAYIRPRSDQSSRMQRHRKATSSNRDKPIG